jgi:NitT/TauT family transport system substrate-binding protein
MISRRAMLGVIGGALLAAGCRGRGGEAGVLRVGCLANLTHTPILAALSNGDLARALAPVRVEARTFRAGPRVVEALLGGAIDVGVCGPAPVVFARARHGGGRLRVVSGCASGGASLVLARDVRAESARDLRGKMLAVTQIGSTQDVALRKYVRGVPEVSVIAMAPAAILAEMRRGTVAGGWLPEPLASRVERELGARRLVDERDLWGDRRFASALVVVDPAFSDRRAADVQRVLDVIHATIDRARAEPEVARRHVYEEMKRHVGNPGAFGDLERAWSRVDFTRDPLPATVARFAEDAAALGLTPAVACSDLFS